MYCRSVTVLNEKTIFIMLILFDKLGIPVSDVVIIVSQVVNCSFSKLLELFAVHLDILQPISNTISYLRLQILIQGYIAHKGLK